MSAQSAGASLPDPRIKFGYQVLSPPRTIGTKTRNASTTNITTSKHPTNFKPTRYANASGNGVTATNNLNVAADWRYRIDYLMDTQGILNRGTSQPSVVLLTLTNKATSLQQYIGMATDYKSYAYDSAPGKEVVGKNNIGEVTFNWSSFEIRHKLWWRLKTIGNAYLAPLPLTEYLVSLSYNHASYPKP